MKLQSTVAYDQQTQSTPDRVKDLEDFTLGHLADHG